MINKITNHLLLKIRQVVLLDVGKIYLGATSTFTDGNGRIDGLFELPDPNVTGNHKFTGERLFIKVTSSATNETVPE